jgi:hypothetical protein
VETEKMQERNFPIIFSSSDAAVLLSRSPESARVKLRPLRAFSGVTDKDFYLLQTASFAAQVSKK